MRTEPYTLFEHLSNVTINKVPWENTSIFTKNYSQYMMNRFIGMQNEFLPLITELNQITIDDETHYNMLLNYMPKQRIFFKYIKKNKELDKLTEQTLMSVFDCSPQEAYEYSELIPKDFLKEFVKTYNSDGGVSSRKKVK